MFVLQENNFKCLWLLVLISFICLSNARQIRYSRNKTEVLNESGEKENGTNAIENQKKDDEKEVEATVREIKLGPYPANDFRPSKAFPLPNEAVAENLQSYTEAQETDESVIVSTTERIDFTTPTQDVDSEASTIKTIKEDNFHTGDGDWAEAENPKAPYSPAGFKPRVPFLLPTGYMLKSDQQREREDNVTDISYDETTELPTEIELKTPYPAAGYRPSKAFLLPMEQLQIRKENRRDVNSNSDNSNHPVCGSSTYPLAPKPLDGETEDPDSEPINVKTLRQRRSQQQQIAVIPARFSVHPLLLARPLFYSAPITSA